MQGRVIIKAETYIFLSEAKPEPFESTNSARTGQGLSKGSHFEEPLFRNEEKSVTETMPTAF